jgi:hypothetical protein
VTASVQSPEFKPQSHKKKKKEKKFIERYNTRWDVSGSVVQEAE